MNKLKKFKGFKTKKQLRKEIKKLELRLSCINVLKPKDVQEVKTIRHTMVSELSVPEEYMKEEVAFHLAEKIKPFIEWRLIGDYNEKWNGPRKCITGTLHIVKAGMVGYAEGGSDNANTAD